MENHTFRSRLTQLLQKSRKALRLYSSLGSSRAPGSVASDRSGADEQASHEFSELQVGEWRRVNGELVRSLTLIATNSQPRQLATDVFSLRDRFQIEWRGSEGELHSKQILLLQASEASDFTRAAILARELVALKAAVQASHAAFVELDELIGASKLLPPAIELTSAHVVREPVSPKYSALTGAGVGGAVGFAEADFAETTPAKGWSRDGGSVAYRGASHYGASNGGDRSQAPQPAAKELRAGEEGGAKVIPFRRLAS